MRYNVIFPVLAAFLIVILLYLSGCSTISADSPFWRQVVCLKASGLWNAGQA